MSRRLIRLEVRRADIEGLQRVCPPTPLWLTVSARAGPLVGLCSHPIPANLWMCPTPCFVAVPRTTPLWQLAPCAALLHVSVLRAAPLYQSMPFAAQPILSAPCAVTPHDPGRTPTPCSHSCLLSAAGRELHAQRHDHNLPGGLAGHTPAAHLAYLPQAGRRGRGAAGAPRHHCGQAGHGPLPSGKFVPCKKDLVRASVMPSCARPKRSLQPLPRCICMCLSMWQSLTRCVCV